MDPLLPSLQPLNMRFSARQAAKGGSRYIGRHLLRMLRTAGFAERRLDGAIAASDEFEEGAKAFKAHFDIDRFEPLVHEGLATQAEVELARAAMSAFLDDPSAMAMMVNVIALATKPEAPPTGSSAPGDD